MRKANLLATIACACWAVTIAYNKILIGKLINQGITGFPNEQQLSFYIYHPFVILVGLLICSLIYNSLNRFENGIIAVSAISLVYLAFYLAVSGGGVF